MNLHSFSLLALAALATADVCQTLRSMSDETDGMNIKSKTSVAFMTENLNYWSTLCSALVPSCIITPKTVDQVSQVMRQISESNENFAIKSGGHNANCGWSSVDGGPLVSMREFNEVTLDRDTETIRIGAGQRWANVLNKLDGTGYTMVGGRMSDVGVGGFVLGGGLSFLSTQYGWAANNVLEYEIVLINGTVTTASADKNPDLWKVLRGGGNNFGVVTTFTARARPIGEIWGGSYIFKDSPKTEAILLAAMRDFAEYYPDPKAALILTRQMSLGIINAWTMFAFYDGPKPPDGIFNNFTAAGVILDTTRKRSYRDLITANSWGSQNGLVFTIGTETFANPTVEHAKEVYNAIHQSWMPVSQSVQDVKGSIGVISYQPIPRAMARLARELGGDMIGLTDDVDRIIVEVNYGHLLHSEYDRMGGATQQTIDNMSSAIDRLVAEGKIPNAARPLFMNDGFRSQDIFARYGPESQQLARKVSAEVDPMGIIQKRTGGFKV
ncbi:Bifunctional solanapyrone synthase [Ceratocystis platani]|uniref:Bifunctional solanapyrone synthase n=1 Tax=Ceratocystis fimbriata f. sp. platani TaxID=88771 RepID=A0A0F8B034_CERFI|nr:Bifunctional solanapyrone synthase [Ceratocystis platani]